MGGDNAPGEIVAGARRAAEELGIAVVLVGPPEQIGDTGGLDVLPASEVIAMDDDPGLLGAPQKGLLARPGGRGRARR